MKKALRGSLLILALGLSGCTGLEALLIGSMVGGVGTSYGKPWLDRYLSPPPPAPPQPVVPTDQEKKSETSGK